MWWGGTDAFLCRYTSWQSSWCKLEVIKSHDSTSSNPSYNTRHPLPSTCPRNCFQVGPLRTPMFSPARVAPWPDCEPPHCCGITCGPNTKPGVPAVDCYGSKLSLNVQFIWENGFGSFVKERHLRAGSPSSTAKSGMKKRFSLVLQLLQINRRLF